MSSPASHHVRVLKASLMLVLMALVFFPLQAFATDELDVSLGLKTIPLLISKKNMRDVNVAIVFDPKNGASKIDADKIKASVDEGSSIPGDLSIKTVLVPTTKLMGLENVTLAFVALGACTKELSEAGAKYGVLTVSQDIDCVQSNRCILGLVSQPSVEIYYSQSAAEAAHVVFSRNFIMMVKRV